MVPTDMQPRSQKRFLTDLERMATAYGIVAEVRRAARRSNYSLYLTSKDAVARIPFILATQQEISSSTFRCMFRSIDTYLTTAALSSDEREFAAEARKLLEELASIERGGAATPAQAPAPVPPVGARGSLIAASTLRGVRSPASRRLAQRDWYLAHVECLTSEQLNELRIELAAKPRRRPLDSPTLSVDHRGATYYPAFQFEARRPRAVVGEVLRVFAERRSSWQVAFWFVSANSWLDGQRPVDRLSDAAALQAAAAQEVTPLGT